MRASQQKYGSYSEGVATNIWGGTMLIMMHRDIEGVVIQCVYNAPESRHIGRKVGIWRLVGAEKVQSRSVAGKSTGGGGAWEGES